jgi:hypothetical protein
MWFWRVSIARSEVKSKNLHISIFGFQTHMSSISYLVYNQIWLNLSVDDWHFGYNKKFLIKNICCHQSFFSYFLSRIYGDDPKKDLRINGNNLWGKIDFFQKPCYNLWPSYCLGQDMEILIMFLKKIVKVKFKTNFSCCFNLFGKNHQVAIIHPKNQH